MARLRKESPARTPSDRAESPLVGEEQGSTWRPAPVLRVDRVAGPETYALFRPAEVLLGDRSAKLRRLEAGMENLRLEDVYSGLVMPWQIDRKDVNESHGSDWDADSTPDYWVSTDTGKVGFASVDPAFAKAGQHHKAVSGSWCCFADAGEAPGNVGGFHRCCVDTKQPGTGWTLVAKLADFGQVLGRESGLRVEFAALVRDDCDALVASVGAHDECRSLFLVDQVSLPSGCVVLGDPAEMTDPGTSEAGAGSGDDGPATPSGMGAGYYPVFLSRDEEERICRITVIFHPGRVRKLCRNFPPILDGDDAHYEEDDDAYHSDLTDSDEEEDAPPAAPPGASSPASTPVAAAKASSKLPPKAPTKPLAKAPAKSGYPPEGK